jgi:hypothetical protein
MFPVGRYDPKNKHHDSHNNIDGNPKGNKRRRKQQGGPKHKKTPEDAGGDNDNGEPKSSLRVIAPDETKLSTPSRMDDEFDLLTPMVDLNNADDMDENPVDMIEVDEGVIETTAAASSLEATAISTIGQFDNMDGDGAEDEDGDDHHPTTMMPATQNKAVSVSVGQASRDEIKAALKIASLPLEQAALVWKLAPFLVENLKRDGFQHFFPIQALSIPDVIASERHYHVQAQDVCITAPTG